MKRKIKFRAWHKINQRFVDLLAIDFRWKETEIFDASDEDNNDSVPLEDIELMQFTGLKDRNGKEIYEGDIIEVENEEYPVITQCVWSEGQFHLEDKAGGHWTRQLYHQPERLGVIGNIYENPELL